MKGPTTKMMGELGFDVSNRSIERHYDDVVDAWVIDTVDAEDSAGFDRPVRIAPTLMRSNPDKDSLSRVVLAFADELQSRTGSGQRSTP